MTAAKSSLSNDQSLSLEDLRLLISLEIIKVVFLIPAPIPFAFAFAFARLPYS
jgi:hypothetical protein